MKTCPICESGQLHEKSCYRDVEYKGQKGTVALLYAECDVCGSEQAGAYETRANKRAMIAFRKEVDGRKTTSGVQQMNYYTVDSFDWIGEEQDIEWDSNRVLRDSSYRERGKIMRTIEDVVEVLELQKKEFIKASTNTELDEGSLQYVEDVLEYIVWLLGFINEDTVVSND